MKIYGKSKYPGLEGFWLETINGEAVIKSITQLTYSIGYFFNTENAEMVVSAIESGNRETLTALACKNSPVFY